MGKKFPAVNGLLLLFVLFFVVSCSDMMDSYSAQGEEEFTRTTADVWIQATTPSFGTSHIRGVAYGNGVFVAVGDSGKVAYSSNGDTWTQVDTPGFGTARVFCVGYGNGVFVAASSYGTVLYSDDGVTWSSTSGDSIDLAIKIRFVNGYFVQVGNNDAGIDSVPAVCYSTDGQTWTEATTVPDFSVPNLSARDIAYGDGVYVIVGGTDEVLYSTDLDTWVLSNENRLPEQYHYTIIYRGGKFFTCTSSGGYISSSTDGTSWSAETTLGWGTLDMRTNGFITLATGGSGNFARSTDMDSWDTISDAGFGTSTIRGVCFGESTIVAVGYDGKIAYSIE